MQVDHKKFRDLLKKLLEPDRLLLTTHVKPDADGWGAQMGLYDILHTLDKDVIIFNNNEYSGPTFSMDSYEPIVFTDEQEFDRSVLENRMVVSLDNSSLERAGQAATYIKPDHSNLIVIDHHDGIPSDNKTFFIFPEASASAEIVCVLYIVAGTEPPLEVAQALYIGLVSDSGHFRYRKTSPLTHRVAARLLKSNVNPAEMAETLAANYSISRLKARQIAYNHLQTTKDNRVAWFALHEDTLKKAGSSLRDMEGLVDELFESKEVMVGILFTQRGPQFTRASFRSRHGVSVLPAAEKYGGGGHKTACAASIKKELSQAVSEIIPIVQENLP